MDSGVGGQAGPVNFGNLGRGEGGVLRKKESWQRKFQCYLIEDMLASLVRDPPYANSSQLQQKNQTH